MFEDEIAEDYANKIWSQMDVSVDIESRGLIVDIALIGSVVENCRVLLKKVCPNGNRQSAGQSETSHQFDPKTGFTIKTISSLD